MTKEDVGFQYCCDMLEQHFLADSKIDWQDNQWWVFDKYGEGLVAGDSIYELIMNLDKSNERK